MYKFIVIFCVFFLITESFGRSADLAPTAEDLGEMPRQMATNPNARICNALLDNNIGALAPEIVKKYCII